MLVARVHDAELIARFVEGVEGAVELDAREAEDRVDPLGQQRRDQRLAAGQRAPLARRRLLLGPFLDMHHRRDPFRLGAIPSRRELTTGLFYASTALRRRGSRIVASPRHRIPPGRVWRQDEGRPIITRDVSHQPTFRRCGAWR